MELTPLDMFIILSLVISLLLIDDVNYYMYLFSTVSNFFSKHLFFFYKQPVYEQLALGWKIAKQLSGINPLLLSNNKNYRLKKSGVFSL